MVIKFESDLGEGWKAYFKPFSNDMWWSLFGFLIVFVGAFKIVGYFTHKIFNINPFAVFYSFCDQGKNIKKFQTTITILIFKFFFQMGSI